MLFSLVAVNDGAVGLRKHWGAGRAEVIENILKTVVHFFHSLTAHTQKRSPVLKFQWTSWNSSLS